MSAEDPSPEEIVAAVDRWRKRNATKVRENAEHRQNATALGLCAWVFLFAAFASAWSPPAAWLSLSVWSALFAGAAARAAQKNEEDPHAE